ncbi:penicillin-binding protein [Epidermidibacterium keratini]|uniref:Penicillin-binding protein n=2 Tax=Epidermidibacterium keratini TaxID=1891644 RepID=A0A7L4YUS3_9ACTN|nr:penicillin-binding protein [Epidermidibacterium keratini]
MLAVSGCVTASDQPKPASVAEQFAADLSAGDYEAASKLTDDPTAALESFNFTVGSLGQPTVEYAAPQVQPGQVEADVTFVVTWKFPAEETWSYEVSGDLKKEEGDWKIVWAPTLIHPQLKTDRRLVKSDQTLASPRVLDRTGQALLTDQLVTAVRLDPAAITDQQGTAAQLAGALGPVEPSITTDSILAALSANTSAFTLVVLRPDVVSGITIPLLAGVTTNQQSRLLTLDKSLRSVAFSGLSDAWQAAYDATTGWRITLRAADDTVIEELKTVEPSQPYDVSTSIDIPMQQAAQAAVDGYSGQAAIVAIQPSTGGVLAVAQNAAADAEGPIALTGQYPPGSTFKLVTTSAVLSAGAAEPNTVLPCPGQASIKGRTIPNDDGFDLGEVPLHTAFAQSCNTTLATLAADLPASALSDEALKYGLGVDYTTPYLTTITGSVPPSANDAEQVEASIGQGKVTASPFGMALAAATVVAGKTPMPILVSGQPAAADQEAPAPSPDVIEALRPMMTETVESGTATAVADIDGLGGKTGTAQYGDGTQSHGWFIGTYKDVAFAVLLTGAGSSKPAVDVAGEFLRPVESTVPGA